MRWQQLPSAPGSPPACGEAIAPQKYQTMFNRKLRLDSRPADAGGMNLRAADAGGARRIAENRDREMVATHQGVRDQSGLRREACIAL
jgi:hypothetical protein